MPALERGERRADAASRSASRGMRGDHGRMIPTMSGLARPELLATTEWLAEHLGRPASAILDARWRPDGTGAEVHRGGPHPGRRPRRLAGRPRRHGPRTRRRDPPRRARTGSPATAERAGIGDGTTVVVYDDTQGLYAARVWWTLRAYGLEHVRILDGGFPAWEAEGRPIERAAGRHAASSR